MKTYPHRLIDALGGTTAVARMTDTPVSTVHSWRRIGIPKSRMAHLKLAAKAAEKAVDWEDPQPVKRAASVDATPASAEAA